MATRKVTTLYKWRIDNFDQQISIVENGGSISSDVFSLVGNSKAKFSMKIENDETDFDETDLDGCHVYLVCNDFGRKREMQLDMRLWWEYEPETKFDSEWTFNKASDTGLIYSGYSPSAMKEDSIENVWTFYCEIEYKGPIDEFDDYDSEEKDFIAHRELNCKLFEVQSSGQLDSTVTIQAGNKEFKANKFTLMACSDVFYRMFSCEDSTEAKTGIIKIEDIKPEVVDALIRWIYQVEVDNIEDIAMELYHAADKYDISFLKDKCIKIMANSLSTENFAPRLILAHKFSEERLKKYILNFIREEYNNLKRLMVSDEWMKLCSEDPGEAKKIVAEIPD